MWDDPCSILAADHSAAVRTAAGPGAAITTSAALTGFELDIFLDVGGKLLGLGSGGSGGQSGEKADEDGVELHCLGRIRDFASERARRKR